VAKEKIRVSWAEAEVASFEAEVTD